MISNTNSLNQKLLLVMLAALTMTLLPDRPVTAQHAEGINWRAALFSDHRAMMRGKPEWVWNENRLDLQIDNNNDRIRVHGQVWMRYLGSTALKNSAGLYDKEQTNPWNLDLREAYVEVYRFLFDQLDIKIGRQQIAWGTADRFNPTDNLNPSDLEDVFDFGRTNGSDACNLQWHFGHASSLQIVYVPLFRPANLPVGYFSDLFQPGMRLPGNAILNTYSDKLHMPSAKLRDQAIAGIRLKGFMYNTDISFSYVYGRDYLPMAILARITPHEEPGQVNVYSELEFPRHHIWGADLSGSIGFVGIWAEAAVFLPVKEMQLFTDYSAIIPPGSQLATNLTTTSLKKEPYVKYVAGADYTFRNGTYLNVQFLHGFMHEKGRQNLNDYLMIALEKQIWHNRMLIRPLAGGFAVTDWKDLARQYAVFYSPELVYKAIDNLEINMGMYVFYGKGDGIFARLHKNNLLHMKFTAYF
jgi:hypothetical protein